MEWILVILAYAGPMSSSDSMALTNVSGFSTQAECQAAGQQAKALTSATLKQTRFVCVQRKKA